MTFVVFDLMLYFVYSIYRANALTPLQTSSLHALVDANNQTVKRIFLNYECDKDVYALIDSLKALRLDPEDGDEEDEEVSLYTLWIVFVVKRL